MQRIFRQRWMGVVLLLLLGWLGACSAIRREPQPLLTPRRAFGASVMDDWVYVAGGWNGEATQMGLVEARNPRTGEWQSAPPLVLPRSQHALVAVNDQLWAVAGWNADLGLVSAVERWSPCHPVTLSPCPPWQIATHLPTPRREPGVALLAGQIIVAGGFNGNSDADLDGFSDGVESYDLASGQWQRLSALQVPRRGLVLVTVEGQLFAIGGYNEDGFSKIVEEYDPLTDRWQFRHWEIAPRTWAASAVVDGDLLLAGGYNQTGFLTLVERIDPNSGEVCQPPPLHLARSWFALASTAQGILALGGETNDGFSNSVERVQVTCESID